MADAEAPRPQAGGVQSGGGFVLRERADRKRQPGIIMITRRTFLATTAAAAAAPAFGAAAGSANTATSSKSAALFLPPDDLKPATLDRLPLAWNKQRVRKLQDTLAELDCDGILLTDRW